MTDERWFVVVWDGFMGNMTSMTPCEDQEHALAVLAMIDGDRDLKLALQAIKFRGEWHEGIVRWGDDDGWRDGPLMPLDDTDLTTYGLKND